MVTRPVVFACLFLVLLGCSERRFNNPVDPEFIDQNLLAPSEISVRVADVNVLELSWEDSEFEDGYQISRSKGTENFDLVASLPENSTQWQDTDVSIDNTYNYRISVTNDQFTSEPSSTASFSYRLLAPSGLTVSQLADHQILLEWEDTNHFEEGYLIDLKVGNGEWQEAIAYIEANTNSWIYYVSVATNPVHYWRMRAYYGPLQSALTNDVSLTVAAATLDPPGGVYTSHTNVTISSATLGSTIHYTTDGSEPTESSAMYSSPIAVTKSIIIKAKVFKGGWSASATSTESYILIHANMVHVPGGTFSPTDTYTVTLSSFFVGKFEVTQAEYQDVMGVNPSHFHGYGANTDNPVEQVTWFNAIEYCNRLNIQEGLTPFYSYSSYGTNPDNWPAGWNTDNNNHLNVSCNWSATGYRLPTEMEWMFAAMGGNQSHGYTYSGSNNIDTVAWYVANSENRSHVVGELNPNELGTSDMSGNVEEWCWDIYGSYPSGSQTNPTGANSGLGRVARGGSWLSSTSGCTLSNRSSYGATGIISQVGFRILRTYP